ncbi:unnamed protein product, partial [Prorocentrum cordatum]
MCRLGCTWAGLIQLCECQSSECEAELEVTPSQAEIGSRCVRYAPIRDLDVYPHILSEGLLARGVALKNDGSLMTEMTFGRPWRAPSAAYGVDGELTVVEVCEALEGKAPWRSSPAAGAGTSPAEDLYPGTSEGSGPLPASDGLSWYVLAAEDPSELRQAAHHLDIDGYLVVGRVGVAMQDADAVPVKAVVPSVPGPGSETDARVLGIKTTPDGSCRRPFTEAACLVKTTEWAEWPTWEHECSREATIEGVGGSDLTMRMAELGLSFGQSILGGVASIEFLMRKAETADGRHRDRLAAVQGGVPTEGSCLYLGAGPSRGLVTVVPTQVDHINPGAHQEAQILKERRQAKEERIQQQAIELRRYQEKGTGKDHPAGLSRSVRSRVRRRMHVANWIADAAESLNALHGHGGARDHFSASAGQHRSLEFMQSIIEQAGPPPCSPAAAHVELRGHQPGYVTQPEQPAQYQREILSLPGPGARCDPSDVLRGLEHDQWVHWERHVLRRTPAPDKEIKLHNDRILMADRRRYAQFILDLHTSGLVRVGAKRSATVGVFCAWKSGRERLRLIFDTRRVNARFHDPDHTQLPGAAAWAALRTDSFSPLSMAQADVDNAFYRVKLPDKMDEHFSLPSVHAGSLHQLAEAAGVDIDLPDARFGSPLLQVLSMGWSWSLYFCQRLLETTPGVYVDNVCIVGGDGDRCVADCTEVVGKLERVGLKCKGVMEPKDLQTFTGITFERRSGPVGISPGRMWKVRLALLFVADRRSATGGEILSLLGHFTWAALLRRSLLSIFQQTYVFARVAGRRRLRLWSRVELELRQAAALLVFAFSDSKRPNSTFVYASDASRGQSGSGGGYGVAGRTWANELVESTAASAEAWRYSVLGAIGARECALGFDPVEGTKVGRRQARAGSASFEGVARSAIGEFNDWGVLFHGEFQRDEDITALEGRAAAMAARHAERGRSGHSHRHLIFVDNLGLALAVGKGRSPSIADGRHRDRLVAVQGGVPTEGSCLYLGAGPSRGLVTVVPTQVDHINPGAHHEAQILKERRQAKEERVPSRGGGGGGGSVGGEAELLKKIQQQAIELRRYQEKGTGKDQSAGHSLEFMQSIIEQAGPPPCFPAAAHVELRGHQPGYVTQPEQPAQYQREIFSLPGPGARCDPSDVLRGLEHDQWVHWERHLLRRTPAPDKEIKLHNDRMLMADRRRYAQFILDLHTSGLVRVGAKRSATADVDNAFYRVKSPDKMDEHFSLPSVHVGSLQQLAEAAGVDIDLLYFCQRLLGTTVLRSGIGTGPLIKDRHAPLQARTSSTQPGVYVDNVCIVGGDGDRCVADCTEVVGELERVGLKCKGVMEPKDLQTFTGITFERRSGPVGISPGRMWKVRLALLFVADRRSATGGEILSLLGHFTWAALLRRSLLSIFQQTYVFARVAGRRRLRLWSRVELELRQAAALLVFAFSDSKRPNSTFVYASDASRGQSGSGGGCGVAGRTWANELVESTAASAEAWRYSVLDAIGARECALGLTRSKEPRSDAAKPALAPPASRGLRGSEPGDPSGPGAAGLGDALHDDPYPLGGLAGLLGGSGAGGANADSSSSSSSDGDCDQPCETDPSEGRGPPPSPGESLPLSPPIGADERAWAEGLTVLQDWKVSKASRVYVVTEYLDFVIRVHSRGPSILGLPSIDSTSSQHLGFLFWKGHPRPIGNKAFAVLPAQRPTRDPMARELPVAAVGVALHRDWRGLTIALALGWGTMVRLPSELVQKTPATLVAPAPRFGRAMWCPLPFPEDPSQVGRSLDAKFRTVFDQLGNRDCHPYLKCHGGAPLGAAVLGKELADTQAKLRPQSDNPTIGYAQHVRDLAEAPRPGPEVAVFEQDADARLGDLPRGRSWRGGDTGGAAVVLTDAAVRRHWRAALRAALSGSRKHQVYLDLFSCTGRVASWLERKSDYAVLRIDVAAHPAFDLLRRVRGAVVIGWLRARVVR